MKTISVFILLIYWSIIISAPVISNEVIFTKNDDILKPMKKPNK